MISPMIIQETCNGIHRYTIQDEMLSRREIECIGEINPESVHSLISQIRYLNAQDQESEITLFINSTGGEVTSGLALYDVMTAVKCPIHTICIGNAASMAAILFAAGKTREMLPHAQLMIHDPLITGNLNGSALQIQSISEKLLKSRETIGSILARHTGKSIEEIYEKTKKDSYFSAEEAVEFGLADGIVYHL